MRTQEDFDTLDAPKKAKCREVILFTIGKTLMNKYKVAEQLKSGSSEMIKGQDIDPRKFYVWYGERNAAYQKTAVPAVESRMMEAVRAMRADPAPGKMAVFFNEFNDCVLNYAEAGQSWTVVHLLNNIKMALAGKWDRQLQPFLDSATPDLEELQERLIAKAEDPASTAGSRPAAAFSTQSSVGSPRSSGVPAVQHSHDESCRNFARGTCHRGSSCKYRHVGRPTINPDRRQERRDRGRGRGSGQSRESGRGRSHNGS